MLQISWRNVPLRHVIALALAAIIAGVSIFNAHTVDSGIVELSGDLAGQSAKALAERVKDDIDRASQGHPLDAPRFESIIKAANASGAEVQLPQAIVISSSGDIIAGPLDAKPLPAAVEKALAAKANTSGYVLSEWGGAKPIAVGYARTLHKLEDATSGLTVLVRQSASTVPAPLKKLHNRVWPWAIFFSLHGAFLAWLAANAISSPLLRLAKASDAIRKGEVDGNLPAEVAYFEVDRLSLSLQSLIQDLKAKERMQAELAESLERQVMERTAELRERNLSLEQANARAEDAIQSKSRFLAAASHDLRQPLQALSLITRRLGRRIKTGDDGELVAKIEQSVSSLSNMFNALLDMTRLDSGIIESRESPIALREFLAAIAEDFKAQCQLRGLDFRFRCPDLHVRGDPVILETMVRNLLSNAEKFTDHGGILLSARKRGKEIAIAIYDTGPGIEPERMSSIFKEFERSSHQADGRNQGLGLGLSIVGRYAKLIDAELSVRSKSGRGTCFTLTVPRVDEPGRTAAKQLTCDHSDFWNRRRVLLLDDDASVLDAMKHELGDHGAKVEAYSSPETAVAALQGGMTFDVAIADYDLAGPENGIQFLERLQSLHRTPLDSLILTGRTDRRTVNAISASGRSWLAKPADSGMIAELLTKHGRVPVPGRSRPTTTGTDLQS